MQSLRRTLDEHLVTKIVTSARGITRLHQCDYQQRIELWSLGKDASTGYSAPEKVASSPNRTHDSSSLFGCMEAGERVTTKRLGGGDCRGPSKWRDGRATRRGVERAGR